MSLAFIGPWQELCYSRSVMVGCCRMYLDGWIQDNTVMWYVHQLAHSFHSSQSLFTEFKRDSSPQWWSLVKHCKQWPLSVQVTKESLMMPPPCTDRHQTHNETEQFLARPSMAGDCLCSMPRKCIHKAEVSTTVLPLQHTGITKKRN